MRGRMSNRGWAVVLLVCLASAVGAADRIIYVDATATGARDGTSWTDAYVRLQDAFTEVAPLSMPVEIRVAQGTYRPSDGGPSGSPRAQTFELRNYLTLAGGYAGVAGSDPNARDVDRFRTVLTGALSDEEDSAEPPDLHNSSRVVVTGREIDESVVLDGLTITRARNYGMDFNQASPSLYRCRFVDNGFAGISAWDCNSVLSGCTFERNGSGALSHGGIDSKRGNLTLIDCAFVENDGGGINHSGTLDLLRCSFIANTDGTAIEGSKALTARQCVFRSNQGGIAGAVECYKTATFIDCDFTDNSARWGGAIYAAADLTLVDCRFIGNSAESVAGAVMLEGDVLRAEGCLFAGNQCRRGAGVISNYSGPVMRMSRCTFVGNRGWYNTILHPPFPSAIATMSECIVWNGPEPFADFSHRDPPAPGIVVTYSNVQGGYAGEGNFDVDPDFVDPGYWDLNGTPDDPNDDIWVTGDYHLKSQAGHWDRAGASWVFDDVTSPCIDAGDPNAPLGNEPFPNGGFVNLGAYAGTREASRSYFGAPVCENQLAGDINGDCKVDDLDVDILMSHWLMDATLLENRPPSITLLSPTEGAEFTAGMAMVLRAEASDSDGRVIRVAYTLRARSENGSSVASTRTTDSTNNWEITWDDWNRVRIAPGWTHTIQAEALDDQGAKTLTGEIEIVLEP